jgi:hypothetical protein
VAGIGKPQQHVLDGREPANQSVILENGCRPAAGLAKSCGVMKLANTGDSDIAGDRCDKPVQDAHQRCLADAGWANYGGNRAFLERERDVAQNLVSPSLHSEPIDCDGGARSRGMLPN